MQARGNPWEPLGTPGNQAPPPRVRVGGSSAGPAPRGAVTSRRGHRAPGAGPPLGRRAPPGTSAGVRSQELWPPLCAGPRSLGGPLPRPSARRLRSHHLLVQLPAPALLPAPLTSPGPAARKPAWRQEGTLQSEGFGWNFLDFFPPTNPSSVVRHLAAAHTTPKGSSSAFPRGTSPHPQPPGRESWLFFVIKQHAFQNRESRTFPIFALYFS